jgi:hypothetical protein
VGTPWSLHRTIPEAHLHALAALQHPAHTVKSGCKKFREAHMQASELKEIFIDELKDIYSAETQLVAALPKMGKSRAIN